MSKFFKMLGVCASDLLDQKRFHAELKACDQSLHYVYSIWRTDKAQPEPFYIGKGNGRRALHHLYPSERRNRVKAAILDKIEASGGVPLFCILAKDINDDDAVALESWFINKVGRITSLNGPLANLTEGGEGRASNRARREAHGRSRPVFADGTRFELLSDAAATLGLSVPAVHQRIGLGWPGYYYVDEGQRERRAPRRHSSQHIAAMRSVVRNASRMVSVDGKPFRSMGMAAREFGVTSATIRERCKSASFPSYCFID